MVVGETPSTRNFLSTGPVGAKSPIFDLFFAHSASAVTPSEKVQITLIENPLCAFQ